MEHRKYHALYFILGVLIAFILVTLMGCDRPQTTGGVYEQPIACGMALTPSCEACQEGLPEDEWLELTCGVDAISAEYYGWNEELNEPIWLCQAPGIPQWLD